MGISPFSRPFGPCWGAFGLEISNFANPVEIYLLMPAAGLILGPKGPNMGVFLYVIGALPLLQVLVGPGGPTICGKFTYS